MNKVKGNMYGFINHTWNPLSGKCNYDCQYCSTKSFMRYPVIKEKYSGELRINERILNENLGTNNYIFVCAQNDIAPAPIKTIKQIFNACCNYHHNTYLIQTKDPYKLFKKVIENDIGLPDNVIIATTIETDDNELLKKYSYAPNIQERILGMHAWKQEFSFIKTMITIEPILKIKDMQMFLSMIVSTQPMQINIGADSKKHNLIEPSKEQIKELIEELKRYNIKLEYKENLKRLL